METVLEHEALPIGIKALNGGYFISRGVGSHPERIIDSFEIIYVARGELRMFEDEKNFVVPSGHALLLQPGKKHGGAGSYPSGLAFFWVHFSPSSAAVEEFVRTLPQSLAMPYPERMTSWFRRFLDDQEQPGRDGLQAGLLILLMLSEFRSSPCRSEKHDGMAGKALEYIKLNFEQPISTATVAAKLQCNPDYLGRIFREAYGHTITERITEERLCHARKRLLESTMNISEITAACGFNDPAYFRRCFVAKSGMTPLKFRRLYGKIHMNTE